MEGSARLSQYYDLLNRLDSVSNPYRSHLKYLESLSEIIQKSQNSLHSVSGSLVAAISSVTRRRAGGESACRTFSGFAAAKYGAEEEKPNVERH